MGQRTSARASEDKCERVIERRVRAFVARCPTVGLHFLFSTSSEKTAGGQNLFPSFRPPVSQKKIKKMSSPREIIGRFDFSCAIEVRKLEKRERRKRRERERKGSFFLPSSRRRRSRSPFFYRPFENSKKTFFRQSSGSHWTARSASASCGRGQSGTASSEGSSPSSKAAPRASSERPPLLPLLSSLLLRLRQRAAAAAAALFPTSTATTTTTSASTPSPRARRPRSASPARASGGRARRKHEEQEESSSSSSKRSRKYYTRKDSARALPR